MVSGNYLAKQFSGKISPAMKPSRRTAWQEILLEFQERVRKFRIKTKDPLKGLL